MSVLARKNKNQEARLDFSLDWSAWLETDTIQGATWEVDVSGLTINDETHTDTVSTIWVEGGTVGSVYILYNEITTVGGRIDGRSIQITVVGR